MTTAIAKPTIKVADEVWIATVMLHQRHPDKRGIALAFDLSVGAIVLPSFRLASPPISETTKGSFRFNQGPGSTYQDSLRAWATHAADQPIFWPKIRLNWAACSWT